MSFFGDRLSSWREELHAKGSFVYPNNLSRNRNATTMRGRHHATSSFSSSSSTGGGKIPTFLAGMTLGVFVGGFASLFVSELHHVDDYLEYSKRCRFRWLFVDFNGQKGREEWRPVEATPVHEVRVPSRCDGNYWREVVWERVHRVNTTGGRGIPDGR